MGADRAGDGRKYIERAIWKGFHQRGRVYCRRGRRGEGSRAALQPNHRADKRADIAAITAAFEISLVEPNTFAKYESYAANARSNRRAITESIDESFAVAIRQSECAAHIEPVTLSFGRSVVQPIIGAEFESYSADIGSDEKPNRRSNHSAHGRAFTQSQHCTVTLSFLCANEHADTADDIAFQRTDDCADAFAFEIALSVTIDGSNEHSDSADIRSDAESHDGPDGGSFDGTIAQSLGCAIECAVRGSDEHSDSADDIAHSRADGDAFASTFAEPISVAIDCADDESDPFTVAQSLGVSECEPVRSDSEPHSDAFQCAFDEPDPRAIDESDERAEPKSNESVAEPIDIPVAESVARALGQSESAADCESDAADAVTDDGADTESERGADLYTLRVPLSRRRGGREGVRVERGNAVVSEQSALRCDGVAAAHYLRAALQRHALLHTQKCAVRETHRRPRLGLGRASAEATTR